jgi:hypothetical protein
MAGGNADEIGINLLIGVLFAVIGKCFGLISESLFRQNFHDGNLLTD